MSRRPPRPLGRASPGDAPRRIAVFTEGKKTEPGYLSHWYRAHRDRVLVVISCGLGAPMTVVDRAVEKKRYEAKEARRGRGRASDEYWCVIDVDQHPNLGPAVEKAIANGISVAVSNPCVELWFILHFQDQAAEIGRNRVQAISKELLKCDKTLDEQALLALDERFLEARAKAKALDAKHLGDGRPPRSNPSSGVWKLIDRITGQAPGDMLPAG